MVHDTIAPCTQLEECRRMVVMPVSWWLGLCINSYKSCPSIVHRRQRSCLFDKSLEWSFWILCWIIHNSVLTLEKKTWGKCRKVMLVEPSRRGTTTTWSDPWSKDSKHVWWRRRRSNMFIKLSYTHQYSIPVFFVKDYGSKFGAVGNKEKFASNINNWPKLKT